MNEKINHADSGLILGSNALAWAGYDSLTRNLGDSAFCEDLAAGRIKPGWKHHMAAAIPS
jgi:hypothetical protein